MQNLLDAVQVTIGGLISGSIYALLLVGILLIYQVSRAVNFAHGSVGMFAAFGSYYLYSARGVPTILAVVLGIAAAVVLSIVIDRGVVARVPMDRPGLDLAGTLGVMLLLIAVAENVFGNSSYRYLGLLTDVQVPAGDLFISGSDLMVVLLLAFISLCLYVVLRRTNAGLALRAVAADTDIARSVGLSVGMVRTVTWGVAGLLAALAGSIIASRVSVGAFYMTPFLIKAFISGIIGGLDRLAAPILVALALGVYEGWVVFVLGAEYRSPAIFLLIVAFLSLAPTRLLEERHEARA